MRLRGRDSFEDSNLKGVALMPASDAPVSTPTVYQAVAGYFASRPTLCQVLEHEVYKLLLARYPSVLDYQPKLLSAESIPAAVR
ncbi:hypothetical protein D3C81_2094290 [compost metagenome]